MKIINAMSICVMALSFSMAFSMGLGQAQRDKKSAKELIGYGKKNMRKFEAQPCSPDNVNARCIRREFLASLAREARDVRANIKPTSASMAKRLQAFIEEVDNAAREI